MGLNIDNPDRGNVIDAEGPAAGADLRIRIRGTGNRIRIGSGLEVGENCSLEIDGAGNTLELGSDVRLDKGSLIETCGDHSAVHLGAHCTGRFGIRIQADQGSVTLGEHCTAIGVQIALREPSRVVLGDDCMLSAAVRIVTGDMHVIFDLDSGQRINPAADVVIGDHVWIGHAAKILKGASIGTGSIVGMGAIVTGAIPTNCMAAGVPARVLRERVGWTRALNEFRASTGFDLDAPF